MSSKTCLILFGLLVAFAVLSAAENNEENSLSVEAPSTRLARSADARRKNNHKSKKSKKTKSGKKKAKNAAKKSANKAKKAAKKSAKKAKKAAKKASKKAEKKAKKENKSKNELLTPIWVPGKESQVHVSSVREFVHEYHENEDFDSFQDNEWKIRPSPCTNINDEQHTCFSYG